MDANERQAAIARWRRKCKPMPTEHVRVKWDRTFTPDEWQRVCRGLIPRQMEDKWFIFAENDTVHFHRGWSGFCIYEMLVEQTKSGASVQAVLVNRDQEQYRWTDDAYELDLLDFIISNLMLGQHKPFPIPSDNSPGNVPGLLQHHLMGTGYPEDASSSEARKK
jgi:hypothetical protein